MSDDTLTQPPQSSKRAMHTADENLTETKDTAVFPSTALDGLFQASHRVSLDQCLAEAVASTSNTQRMDMDTEADQPKGLKKNGEITLFSFVDVGGYSPNHDTETSVCTIIWIRRRAVLVGSASADIPDLSDSRRFLQTYFFRLDRMYPRAIHMVAVERNCGSFTASGVHESIRLILPNVTAICETPPRVGVSTDLQSKCNAMVEFLDRVKAGGLGIAEEADFVTMNVTVSDDRAEEKGTLLVKEGSTTDDYENVLTELKAQLTRMRHVDTRNGIPVFSGKGARGSGLRDDRYVGWSGAILWSLRFMERAVLTRELQHLTREFLASP